jgi:hypothetical protein
MKTDRMSAYEAPRAIEPERQMRDITLRLYGRRVGGSKHVVQIPKSIALPDLIRWRGHTFIRKADDTYAEATMWPIVEDLD